MRATCFGPAFVYGAGALSEQRAWAFLRGAFRMRAIGKRVALRACARDDGVEFFGGKIQLDELCGDENLVRLHLNQTVAARIAA